MLRSPSETTPTDGLKAAAVHKSSELRERNHQPIEDSDEVVAEVHDSSERETVLNRMMYWRGHHLPRKNRHKKKKYLLFDTDCGGFNNIRIAFEIFVILAWLTDRTLVLPPPRGWYLLDFGPQTRMKGGTGRGASTRYSEFFNMEDLWQAVPWITTSQFVEEEADSLQIPDKFLRKDDDWDESLKNEWVEYKWKNWKQYTPAWDPYTNVIIWPSIAKNPILDQDRLARRRKIEYGGDLKRSPVMNMASCKGQGWRFLGQVANYILYKDQGLRVQQYQLLKYHVHFKKQIFDIASRVVAFLGFQKYTALHIRRNELQYKENFIPASKTLRNVKALLQPREVLYIASDEPDPLFWDYIKKKHETFFWKDFFTERGGNVLTGVTIPRKMEGCVEQVIAACGRLFFGTKASTFSSYIYRLHGYMKPEDDIIRTHNKRYNGDPVHDAEQPYYYTAVEYMVEFPYLWRLVNEQEDSL